MSEKTGFNPFIVVLVLIFMPLILFSQRQQSLLEKRAEHGESAMLLNIIPRPESVQAGDGFFTLNRQTVIYRGGNELPGQSLVRVFREAVSPATGFLLEETDKMPQNNAIVLVIDKQKEYGQEAYFTRVTPSIVHIEASTDAGLFYGLQSLLQLFPPEIRSSRLVQGVSWIAPAVVIRDKPAFPYRGAHLDVCRHFFPIDSVKRYIDHLARYKMNHFHWHLTDDQGWRIEIKKYPRLASVASCRDSTLIGHFSEEPRRYDRTRYCGYYTKEDAREIVRYAAERHIVVVPEIEMPGHARAALSAYPELSCNPDMPHSAAPDWGVFDDVFCPNEKTFAFLEDVLTEIMDIFPSPYIHIGGDECPKKAWKESPFCQELMKKMNLKDEHELQSYFIKRVDRFVTKKGRKVIGWDEILEGGLADNAAVMSWQGIEGGIAAAEQGHPVVMTPTSYAYFDYYQGDPREEPLAIGGFVPLSKVYHYQVIPAQLSPEKHQYILGPQCNLWTEYISTFQQVEYMILPRLLATAESGWTRHEHKDWDSFCQRLPYHFKMLDIMGVSHGKLSYNLQFLPATNEKGDFCIQIVCDVPRTDIVYTTDGTRPTLQSTRYVSPIPVKDSITIQALPVAYNKEQGQVQEKVIKPHAATLASVYYTVAADDKYSGNAGTRTLVDGIHGSTNFGDGCWQGFLADNCSLTFDLGNDKNIREINLSALQSSTSYILFPKKVSVEISRDSLSWESIAETSHDFDPLKEGNFIRHFSISLPANTKTRYLKVTAHNPEVLPPGHGGAGSKSWIFIDEIEVR
ncbi:MAG: family 20 glycosylhydrolase [Bacteroidales bacterium]|jgi:hexosaminidase|nr:family 20 glycosylhydrolase [Bacteroidales bacterium]